MRTHTRKLLLMPLAIFAIGPACKPPGTGGSEGTGAVKDGPYEVCSVDEYAGGTHLNLWDQIEIKTGKPVSAVKFTMYDPPLKAPLPRAEGEAAPAMSASKPNAEVVPMITCCGGEQLGGTKAFIHEGRPVLHAVIIENAAGEHNPGKCTREPLLTIKFCSPAKDDSNGAAWECRHGSSPHGGDVHAQPQ
jgi:hypothetical protein